MCHALLQHREQITEFFVPPINKDAEKEMQKRLDSLTKPIGSLGVLEEIAVKLAGIQGTINISVDKSTVFIFAGDHGVARHHVSAYPQEVTAQMLNNFSTGGAAINVISGLLGCDLKVVNVGVIGVSPHLPGIIHRVVREGTRDFTEEMALTPEEVQTAIEVGQQLILEEISRKSMDIIVLGDMGIANTTVASAITAKICGCDPIQVTGPGTGLDDFGIARKVAVIRKALELHSNIRDDDPIGILAAVGGIEIAALVGAILAAVSRGKSVILDGFIVGAAGIVAHIIEPAINHYMFAGHGSSEPGHRVQLECLGLTPILRLNMRLGEGTGATAALHIIKIASAIATRMRTFDEAGVSEKAPFYHQYDNL